MISLFARVAREGAAAYEVERLPRDGFYVDPLRIEDGIVDLVEGCGAGIDSGLSELK